MSNVDNFFKKENEERKSDNNGQETFRISLNTLGEDEIINIFDDFHKEGRQIVIPIGFPAAGKSLFISSLMYYAEKNSDKKWDAKPLSAYPFIQGDLSRDTMIRFFDQKKAYPVTPPGTLDLIGINIIPHNKKLRQLKLAFVDLAGEDLKNFRADKRKNLNPKVTAILKACRLDQSDESKSVKPIFCLITPFSPLLGHDEENALFSNFLSYIAEDKHNFNPLYQLSKYIVLVSQWDKNTGFERIDEANDYIKKYRQALHTAMESRNSNQFVYGEYSVGFLEDTKDKNNKPVVLIRRIANDYPHKFWCQLYELATGKSLQPKGFWAKLLGF